MSPNPNFPPIWVLGKVSVPTAGTPVGLLDAFTPLSGLGVGVVGGLKAANNGGTTLRVASILLVVAGVITVNTGFIYVGVKGMLKATGVGVFFAIPAAAVGVTNWFTLPAVGWGGGNELEPENIYLDADTNGNSVLASLYQY